MALRYACAWRDSGAAEARLAALGGDRRQRGASRSFAVSPLMAAALLDDPGPAARGDRELGAAVAAAGGAASAPGDRRRAGRPDAAAPGIVARRGDRLRVGYLSSDFHDHATAYLAAGVFERHDRARVESFAYALDRDDGGAMRRRLIAAFDHFADVRALPDAEVAARIAADGLDVLVDIKGHTHGARFGILARRPAPRQIHWLGFPGTLAPRGDRRAGRRSGRRAAGRRAPLRRDGAADAGLLPAQRPRPAAAAGAARASVGLPERGAVLACFNQTYKLTPPFLDVWLDALAAHGDAVLWLTRAARARAGEPARRGGARGVARGAPRVRAARRAARRTSRACAAPTWRSTCCPTVRTRPAATRCGPACRC